MLFCCVLNFAVLIVLQQNATGKKLGKEIR